MNRPLALIVLSLTMTAAALLWLMWLVKPVRPTRHTKPAIGNESNISPKTWPTFAFLPTQSHHIFAQGTKAPWPTIANDSTFSIQKPGVCYPQFIDPFAGASSFTLHLRNFGPGDWCHPLPGANVISPYGERDGRQHTGTDLKTVPGDTIRAAFAGVVFMSEPFSGYGNCVQLRHGNGLTTLYSHNERNLVKAGQTVATGQPIAIEGRTGRATTEHLHFEIRVDGQPYNSELVFDHENGTLRRHSIVFRKNSQPAIQ